jgi:hypothetical protein
MKGNKSKRIRDISAEHPDIKPKQIAAKMKKEGHCVTPGYVSTILSNAKRRTQRKMKGFSAASMGIAKELVKETGSIKAAKIAIDIYASLSSRD